MTNPELNCKLKNIVKALVHQLDLIYYTNRSLKQKPPYEVNGFKGDPVTSMEAAFILKHQPSLYNYAQIINWLSSTCAELAAIFMALLTALKFANIEIHTDSLATI